MRERPRLRDGAVGPETRTATAAKALRHILETLPRDELFQPRDDCFRRPRWASSACRARVRSKLFVRRDRYGRFFSTLVYVPRERMSTQLRHRIGRCCATHWAASGSTPTCRSAIRRWRRCIIIARARNATAIAEVDLPALEAMLAEIVRDWRDGLRDNWWRAMARGRAEACWSRMPRTAGRLHRGVSPGSRPTVLKSPACKPGDPAPLSLPRRAPVRTPPALQFATARCASRCRKPADAGEHGPAVFSSIPSKWRPTESASSRTSRSEPLAGRLESMDQAELRSTRFDAHLARRVENDGFNRLVLAAADGSGARSLMLRA